MIFNTFTTKAEAEAEAAQEQDYQLFITGGYPDWVATTIKWADVIELADGKWGYTPYLESDNVYSTADYAPTNLEGI